MATSDIEPFALADGSLLAAVPDQEAWNATPWGLSVRVVRLPKGF